MKEIFFKDPHRRKHFEHFREMSYPHFQVTAKVPIDPMYSFIKRNGLHFTSAVVYWLTRSTMMIAPFCQRIRGDKIVEHERLDPSFAVLTETSDVFSFCTVEFHDNYHMFELRSKTEMEKMKTHPSFEDEEGKDNFIFMSALPWVHFTGIQHPISIPADSVPRMTWGRIEDDAHKRYLPLSIQAHHGLVDGRDMGRLFQLLELNAQEPSLLFDRKTN